MSHSLKTSGLIPCTKCVDQFAKLLIFLILYSSCIQVLKKVLLLKYFQKTERCKNHDSQLDTVSKE